MSKTPLTDAAAFAEDGAASVVVTADFARSLETDRAELVGEVERLADAIEDSLDGSASMPGYATVKRLRALLDRLEADK